eukprot:TRINITY_DN12552_c0_g1_i2.p1 TRINITY_DN12552_c0_g1~~TRINITY_DN12552_c0_g1_i2.p1  ORF type:complete len:109 (-),score=18.82 TRINITY_DN12552_c0_g1_i2:261-587(-)
MTPPCRTVSVQHSSAAAAALEGMSWFGPNMAFDPADVSSTMMSLLLYDLAAEESAANPNTELLHPCQLFWSNAFHGGAPRCAFQTNSIGSLAFMLGKLGYSAKPWPSH